MRAEINLIGRTVDEATDDLEKYLDHAFLAGLPRVRVIHGHGAGILRRGVREFLKGHPHVAGIEEAPQNEGGRGRDAGGAKAVVAKIACFDGHEKQSADFFDSSLRSNRPG